jgi:hypothetical protein
MSSEGWKEIELNYCGNRVKGSDKVVGEQIAVASGTAGFSSFRPN